MDFAYVLWADILGFSNLMDKLDSVEDRQRLVTDWKNLIQTAKDESGIAGAEAVHTDACLAFAQHNECGLKALIEFAQMLLNEGVQQKIFVRGAIDCGPIHGGKASHIDDTVRRAHEFEGNMQWVGIACTRNVTMHTALWSWDRLVVYPVPCKTGDVRLRPAVVWGVPPAKELIDLIGARYLKDGDHADWTMIHKAQPTAQFGRYIEAGRKESSLWPDSYGAPEHLLM